MSPAATMVCDLDGVVYLGETEVPGAGAALRRVAAAGWRLIFATNNSVRPPAAVRDKIRDVVGLEVDESQIVTSSMVAVSLIDEGPVLVMGEVGITWCVAESGFEMTDSPDLARAVIAGLDRGITYDRIDRAAAAVRDGARFIVTNRDPTYPTEDGLQPGAGACAAAVETAAGVQAITAGKPSTAMRRFLEARSAPGPIWIVGDRPDTDLALASGPRWRSALVLTGVTAPGRRVEPEPDLVVADLTEAVTRILGE